MAAEQVNVRAQTNVHGTIRNEVQGPLTYLKSHNWSGQVSGNYPQRIQIPGTDADFVHNASGANGSKAAVVYYRFGGPKGPVAWLVGWWLSGTNTRVYVESGPKQNYDNIDWNAIEQRVNRGGQSYENSDFETDSEASATINNRGILDVTFKLD